MWGYQNSEADSSWRRLCGFAVFSPLLSITSVLPSSLGSLPFPSLPSAFPLCSPSPEEQGQVIPETDRHPLDVLLEVVKEMSEFEEALARRLREEARQRAVAEAGRARFANLEVPGWAHPHLTQRFRAQVSVDRCTLRSGGGGGRGEQGEGALDEGGHAESQG